MLAKSYDIFPKLHDMPFGSVSGMLKTMVWRLYKFQNPNEWSLRHEKDSRYLASFSDLADILAGTTQ